MCNSRTLEQLAATFQVLGERNRLHILALLCQGERSAISLCEELGMRRAPMWRHLRLLRRADLIGRRLDGMHYYEPAIAAAAHLFSFVVEGYTIQVSHRQPE